MQVIDYLILDLAESILDLASVCNSEGVEVTSVVNLTLSYLYTDTLQDSVLQLESNIYNKLEYRLNPYCLEHLIDCVLALVQQICKEFTRLGVTNTIAYKVRHWLSPTVVVLESYLPYEITDSVTLEYTD